MDAHEDDFASFKCGSERLLVGNGSVSEGDRAFYHG